VTITRLRDGLTLFIDNARRLEAAVERNTGMKRSALETADMLRESAARGLEKGKEPEVQREDQERKPPELERTIVKPFEIGI
jgi:hypothetical protein